MRFFLSFFLLCLVSRFCCCCPDVYFGLYCAIRCFAMCRMPQIYSLSISRPSVLFLCATLCVCVHTRRCSLWHFDLISSHKHSELWLHSESIWWYIGTLVHRKPYYIDAPVHTESERKIEWRDYHFYYVSMVELRRTFNKRQRKQQYQQQQSAIKLGNRSNAKGERQRKQQQQKREKRIGDDNLLVVDGTSYNRNVYLRQRL